ncbi:helix-turn-helix domain-containing protein [Chroococcidiopsis sp. CCNUC1]|uniref:helix-turn-helix domain-containing protein n=1 Tax=Chroococcidiopsis sp. CCNUC1 TaxID=2653189 RepID=UPI0020214A14|nr:helix-turn-helix domain-containing protein [Chroococcidiopsis sp. CCNUC1]URD53850.1 helix-turn-helix domain-containing protein [Chroococcidiopsis sp. CCNUC1]
MIYHTYIPRSPLLQFVSFFWSSEGDDLPQAQVRLLPIGAMEIVINLRQGAIALYDRHSCAECGSTSSSRLSGIHSENCIIDRHSQVAVIGLRFKPGGSQAFFSLPAGELHNRIVSLDDLWNCRAAELRERLLEAPSGETRFLVLERFLLSQMLEPPKQQLAVNFALRKFGQFPTPTVNSVIDQIGFSTRHFGQLFRDRVGLTPKLFCRVRRWRQVLYLLDGKDRVDWIGLAHSCGYFDQSHLIHDFHTFAGCTPTVYLKQRGLHPCHLVLPN